MTQSEQLNIAFVTGEYPPKNVGGAGISSKLIVEELRNQGVAVDVFALSSDATTLIESTPSHFELPSGKSYPMLPHVGTAVSSYKYTPNFEQYDLVHCYGPKALPGIAFKSDVPVVATIVNFAWVCINPIEYLKAGCPCYGPREAIKNARAGGYTRTNSLLSTATESIGKRLAKRTDAITVQTEGMRRILANCGYDSDSITVIPNVLDERFLDSGRTNESGNTRKLIFVGRLVNRKGGFDVVRSFARLSEAVRDKWTFELYGSGPQYQAIEKVVTEHNIDVEVKSVPYEDMPTAVYSDAAAVVHASKYPEPFSRVWLEAMATGTPIICSENPSSRSVLDGIAEFFDPFDTSTLVSSLQKMLQNPTYRTELAQLGRRTVDRYRVSHVVPRYVELYENTVTAAKS